MQIFIFSYFLFYFLSFLFSFFFSFCLAVGEVHYFSLALTHKKSPEIIQQQLFALHRSCHDFPSVILPRHTNCQMKCIY